MTRFQNIEQLVDFVESHFGKKVRVLALNRSDQEMAFSLYDTFIFRTGLDPRTKVFGLGLELTGNRVTKTLLGERFSPNNDEVSIAASLEHADKFCRLSLPDKILEIYDNLES